MAGFIFTLVTCSITMSVLALLLIALTPVLSQRYKAKWCYYAWLIIIIGLIIPYRPQFDTAFIHVKPTISHDITKDIGITSNPNQIMPDRNTTNINHGWYQIISYIWLAGAILSIIYHFLRHRNFLKTVNRWSKKIHDQTLLETFQHLKVDMGIISPIELKLCVCITSPMIIGFNKPKILLPTIEYTARETALILKHELTHFKRKDLWFKALLITATTLHWFNPVIYLIAMAVNRQCEVACDEAVLENIDLRGRQVYGETIIRTIKQQPKYTTALSTSFYEGKQSIRNRIFAIMDRRKKKIGIALFLLIFIATVSTGVVFAINSQTNHTITPSVVTMYNIIGSSSVDNDQIQVELIGISPIKATNEADTVSTVVLKAIETADHIPVLTSISYEVNETLKSAVDNSLIEFTIDNESFVIKTIEMK